MIKSQITNFYYYNKYNDTSNSDSGSISDNDNSNDSCLSRRPELAPTVIRLYGIYIKPPTNSRGDNSNKEANIIINATGFKPYFFIEIPKKWQSYQINEFVINILKPCIAKKFRDGLIKWKTIKKKPFDEFTANDKFTYLKLFFINKESHSKYRWVLKKKINNVFGKSMKFKVLESSVDPYVRFIHRTVIQPSGWISIDDGSYKILYGENIINTLEITCHYKKIKPMNDRKVNANFKQCSFDIESNSSHGDFPLAIKNYQKFASEIINLSTTHNLTKELLIRIIQIACNPNYMSCNITNFDLEDHSKPNDKIIRKLAEKVVRVIEPISKANNSYSEDQENKSIIDKINEILTKKLNSYKMPKAVARLSRELIENINRLNSEKKHRWLNNQINVIITMIEIAFDEVYDGNITISEVYPKNPEKIDDKLPPLVRLALEIKFQNKLRSLDSMLDTKNLEIFVPNIMDKIKNAHTKKKSNKKNNSPDEESSLDYDEKNKDNEDEDDSKLNAITKILDLHLPKLEGDPIIQIGNVFKKLNEPNSYLKHIITLKNCDKFTNTDLVMDENKDQGLEDTVILKLLGDIDPGINLDEMPNWSYEYRNKQCAKIFNKRKEEQLKTDQAEVVIECYDTEKEVMLAWTRSIRQYDPDILMGYYIFGFDLKFMIDRASELGILEEFLELGRTSRSNEDIPTLRVAELTSTYTYDEDIKETIIKIPGRTVIDICKVIKKTVNLGGYSLNNVCREYLNKAKNDVSPQEIFKYQRLDDHHRGLIARYCIIDCVLCERVADKLQLVSKNIAMANVSLVPLDYIFSRGQSIKIQSLVTFKCSQNGFLIPDNTTKNENNMDTYAGAFVLEPETNIHEDDPISVGDFASLYPSVMRAYNVSHDSCVKKGGKYDNLPGYEYFDITYDNYKFYIKPGTKTKIKIKTGTQSTSRFVQNIKNCILPSTLKDLLDARKAAKKRMAEETDPFVKSIWDGIQLAYKITANSLYGQTGTPTSEIYKQELAASTTALGRMKLLDCKVFMEEYAGKTVVLDKANIRCKKVFIKSSKCIYGDTDSNFIRFECYYADNMEKITGIEAIWTSIEVCTKLADEFSETCKFPIKLEFEKVIMPFVLMAKKRYTGRYYTVLNSDKFYDNAMGMELKRRDSANIVKIILGRVVDIILNEKDIEKALADALCECKRVLNDEYGMEEFIITKKLNDNYANPGSIAHRVLANRHAKREPGNKFNPGDRVPYAFVKLDPSVLKKLKRNIKQGDRIELPDYIRKHNLKLDYEMYLTNQIFKPICRIFDLRKKNSIKIFTAAMNETIARRFYYEI